MQNPFEGRSVADLHAQGLPTARSPTAGFSTTRCCSLTAALSRREREPKLLSSAYLPEFTLPVSWPFFASLADDRLTAHQATIAACTSGVGAGVAGRMFSLRSLSMASWRRWFDAAFVPGHCKLRGTDAILICQGVHS